MGYIYYIRVYFIVMNLKKQTGTIPTNDSAGKPILDGNPVLDTDYLEKMLRTTDHHSIEKLYCNSDDHAHVDYQPEILINLTSFWLILDAKFKLEDPDWWGHDEADAVIETEADLKGYSSSCMITFEIKDNDGYRLSIATYDYNTMDLKMTQSKGIDPLIDSAKCIKDNIIKWIKINHYFIKNISYPIRSKKK